MAWTPAEKQRRYRERVKERLKAAGKKVEERNPKHMSVDELRDRIVVLAKEIARRAGRGRRRK